MICIQHIKYIQESRAYQTNLLNITRRSDNLGCLFSHHEYLTVEFLICQELYDFRCLACSLDVIDDNLVCLASERQCLLDSNTF